MFPRVKQKVIQTAFGIRIPLLRRTIPLPCSQVRHCQKMSSRQQNVRIPVGARSEPFSVTGRWRGYFPLARRTSASRTRPWWLISSDVIRTSLGPVGLGTRESSSHVDLRREVPQPSHELFVPRIRSMDVYPSAASIKTAQASNAAIRTDGASRPSPRDEDVLPDTAVCVADPVPAAIPVPLPAGADAAVPGVALTVVLGTNGTPFIAAWTTMPSPTLIQSSCVHTHDVSQRLTR